MAKIMLIKENKKDENVKKVKKKKLIIHVK